MVILLLLTGPALVFGQGGGQGTPVRGVTDDEVNCENVPLDVCGSAACARWRAQVRTLLEGGATRDEVIAYFVAQFGDRAVGTPQDPMLSLLSWAVPTAAVILGVGIVGVVFVRWRAAGGADAETPPGGEDDDAPDDDDDYRARLERELRMDA